MRAVRWLLPVVLFAAVPGSRLQTFRFDGGLTPVAGLPGGFINVGLAAVAPVPEPSSCLPVTACLMAGFLLRGELKLVPQRMKHRCAGRIERHPNSGLHVNRG
jgi:hypothetical protein